MLNDLCAQKCPTSMWSRVDLENTPSDCKALSNIADSLSLFIDIADHAKNVPNTKLVSAISQVIVLRAMKCGHPCLFSSSQIIL